MRRVAGGVVVALMSGLMVTAPGAAAPMTGAERSDAPVVARSGELTSRAVDSGTGSRRLSSASVKQDLDAERVSGTVVLDAAPGPGSYLRVSFGELVGSNCSADVEFATPVTTPSAGFTRNGRTLTMSVASDEAGYETWDCAFAALASDLSGSPVTYSVLIGELSDIHATPVLAIASVELLGGHRIKLVRGVPTALDVEVVNRGRADTGAVHLTGKGKGLKVKKVGPERIYADGTGYYRVVVTLKGHKDTRLKLKATGGGASAKSKVKVKPRAAPAAPSPGKYRINDGDVTFTVTATRKIKNFRVRARTTCGGYPSLPTYTMNTYDYPTTKIARNGIVDDVSKHDLYTVKLRLSIRGSKVTKGQFNYGGPARCFASESFRT